MPEDTLNQLVKTIRERKNSRADTSYTKSLLDAGPARCAKKLGEEAVETVIAGMAENNVALQNEAADLLYHLLVLLECRGVALADVLKVLDDRMGISGLEEKASRQD